MVLLGVVILGMQSRRQESGARAGGAGGTGAGDAGGTGAAGAGATRVGGAGGARAAGAGDAGAASAGGAGAASVGGAGAAGARGAGAAGAGGARATGTGGAGAAGTGSVGSARAAGAGGARAAGAGGASAGGAGAAMLEVLGLEVLEVLEVLVLEVLELLVLEVLVLKVLELLVLEVLELLVLEVLELEVLEVLELLVLEVLELLKLDVKELLVLEVLALEVLEVLELLVLEVLELLVLEVLELEVLEVMELLVLEVRELLVLEVLELEVMEVLELPELEVLELEVLEVLELVVLEVLEVLEVLALLAVRLLYRTDRFSIRGRSSLSECREPESRPASLVRTVSRACRSRPPPIPDMHTMALRPSSVPQRVALPSPPASSLPDVPDPETDLARAASPIVTRPLATVVTDPSFESLGAFALVTELVDFAASRCLDSITSLVTESESVCLLSVGGELALSSDVLEDRQFELEFLAAALPHSASMLLCPEGDPDALGIPIPRSYAEAIADEYSSQWQIAMDAEMASWKSTGTCVDEVPPPWANIGNGMWIFRVKRPPSSLPAFKARYVARGFSQRQGVNFFLIFSPTPKMTILRVLLHVAAQREYELHSLEFSTTLLQGSLHGEIWLRHPPGFTGSFPEGTQRSLRRPVYGLR
ncbi:unnamed protein product [Closterium sp. NIES-64]|nr:unnamed protein product [Closterium sp. NIES-64]